MCTAHGERRLISIRLLNMLKESVESKLNGQTDSHAYLWVVQSFDTKSLKSVIIDWLLPPKELLSHVLS